MADLYEEGAALTREGLFQLLTDEAFRDGIIEEWEGKVLNTVAHAL